MRRTAPHIPNTVSEFDARSPGRRCLGASAFVLLLAACASPAPPPSTQHLDPPPPVAGRAPEFAVVPPLPKPPKPVEKPELYSVVVHETAVQDLLFAIARDAKLNVSIHPGITGTVTMSVIDQTLTEILDVISKQVDMRYELNGKMLSISQDLPFLKIYRIDYPNIARTAQSTVSISTNIASTGGGPGSSTAATGSNASDSIIKNTANNQFWETLVNNLREILRETDRLSAAASSSAATVTAVSAGAGTAQNNTVANQSAQAATSNSSANRGGGSAAPAPAARTPR